METAAEQDGSITSPCSERGYQPVPFIPDCVFSMPSKGFPSYLQNPRRRYAVSAAVCQVRWTTTRDNQAPKTHAWNQPTT